jgi:hypothetical protein
MEQRYISVVASKTETMMIAALMSAGVLGGHCIVEIILKVVLR